VSPTEIVESVEVMISGRLSIENIKFINVSKSVNNRNHEIEHFGAFVSHHQSNMLHYSPIQVMKPA